MSYPDIALIGKMGSGKTTIARLLESEFGYTPLHFATPIKEVAQLIWADVNRDHLQKLGVAVRDIDENAWANVLLRKVDNSDSRIVVDDCRFPNEYQSLKERGFRIVRIIADRNERVRRLTQIGRLQDESQLEHSTETGLDDADVDYTITNDGTEDDLRKLVAEFMYREDLKS